MRRRLPAEDCAAFEEHYFQCDQCFEEVREMEKFVTGMRQAGRTGLLDPKPQPGRWFMPAFAFAAAASVLLAAGLSFLVFVRLPEREASLQQALRDAAESRRHAAELELRAAADAPEANVPVVILAASRTADSPNPLILGPQSRSAVLWIDVPPQPAGTQFELTISAPDGHFTKSIQGLERNANGALAASLPVKELADGAYQVRLFGGKSPKNLIGEYRLTVGRR